MRCVTAKLSKALNNFLEPIREKRAFYEARPDDVRAALAKGSSEARVIAQETMAMVKDALKINYLQK